MAQKDHILGVDFGTSNSAAGYLCDGKPRLIEMAPGQTTLPTTFFFAVEHGKIATSMGNDQSGISLTQVERGLSVSLPVSVMAAILAPQARMLRAGAQETLQLAGLKPDQVEHVIYVGGSSLMLMVSETMKQLFHNAQHSFSEVFTAVADGLAIASA